MLGPVYYGARESRLGWLPGEELRGGDSERDV